MFDYEPLLISFILDLSPNNLKLVKTQLVEIVRKLDLDDRCYIFHENYLEIPRYKGESIGNIANYKHFYDFNLADSIRYVSSLTEQEEDYKKFTFAIIDRSKDFNPLRIKRYSKNLHIIDLGSNELPTVEVQQLNVDGITNFINNLIKASNDD